VSDGLSVVVARSCHRRYVLVERQTSIEHDSQHLHSYCKMLIANLYDNDSVYKHYYKNIN